MKELAQLLNAMQQAGVIRNYAVFGAVAQMRYTEPVATSMSTYSWRCRRRTDWIS